MRGNVKHYQIKGILTLASLFITLIGMEDKGRGFWPEFFVALGFMGLTMLTLQIILTARFSTIEAPYGVDIVIESS